MVANGATLDESDVRDKLVDNVMIVNDNRTPHTLTTLEPRVQDVVVATREYKFLDVRTSLS